MEMWPALTGRAVHACARPRTETGRTHGNELRFPTVDGGDLHVGCPLGVAVFFADKLGVVKKFPQNTTASPVCKHFLADGLVRPSLNCLCWRPNAKCEDWPSIVRAN